MKLTCDPDLDDLQLRPAVPVEGASVDPVVVEGRRPSDKAQVGLEGELELLLGKKSRVFHLLTSTWLPAGGGGDLV